MNYPIWYLPQTGGGLLIALIAILHVYVSHFAVGGGLYLIYAEKKGLRQNSEQILDFTKKHARFFLLLTMVFGSITGVGIWFIISLVNPAATSFLIHNFVFGWAAEWVFFVVEIAAAFVYFYMFGRMDSATHLKVGWLYFIAAWMSLFLINGIICAMLTPGAWAENLNFWVGFFNPSFFPSLFFRTFIAVMIAAIYGYFSAAFTKDDIVREEMTRFSAKWALAGLVLAVPSGIWYLSVLPEQAHGLVMGKSPTIGATLPWGLGGTVVLIALMLGAGIFRPSYNLRPIACMALLSGLAVMGSFEWIREAARRPYVINEVMYSNSIMKNSVEKLRSEGYLHTALWVEHREITPENKIAAGQELFIHQCYACHTVHGKNNDIVADTQTMSFRALASYIQKIHKVRYFMPPFAGTEEEGRALAAYIVGELHGKDLEEMAPESTAGAVISGKTIFEDHCSSCHVPEDVSGAFEGTDRAEIDTQLRNLNELSDEMEPFGGTDSERKILTDFLFILANPGEEGGVAATEKLSGELLFEDNCSACHEAKDLSDAVDGHSEAELLQMLQTLDQISDEMEPFSGTEEEQESLAEYLKSLISGGE